MAALTIPEFQSILLKSIQPCLEARFTKTFRRHEIYSAKDWKRFKPAWNGTEMVDILLHVHPLALDQFSGIGLHRFGKRNRFTAAEARLVDLVFANAGPLHEAGF